MMRRKKNNKNLRLKEEYSDNDKQERRQKKIKQNLKIEEGR